MTANTSESSQSQPPTATPPAKSNKTRNVVLIVIGVILASCIVFGASMFGVVMNATQPVVTAGDAFMTALKDGNYDRAYALSSSGLQQKLQDAQGFRRTLNVSRLPLKSWSFSSRSINNAEGHVAGSGELEDGRTVSIDLQLEQTGDDWKVSAFNIQPQ
jgi:hypothetical protein